jgi:hypothetical protein
MWFVRGQVKSLKIVCLPEQAAAQWDINCLLTKENNRLPHQITPFADTPLSLSEQM